MQEWFNSGSILLGAAILLGIIGVAVIARILNPSTGHRHEGATISSTGMQIGISMIVVIAIFLAAIGITLVTASF